MKGGIETPFASMHWFIGVVEDNKDPEAIGRARVRAIGYHSEDRDAMPIESLPWAQVGQPAPYGQGYGASPTAIALGTWVYGWFLDGEIAQQPLVIGTLPAKPAKEGAQPSSKGFSDPSGTLPRYYDEPDTSRVARGVASNTIYETSKTELDGPSGEPASQWSPEWPYNRVTETPAGHVLELDDTPGKERIHTFHKSGSFYEFHPDGSLVIKTKGKRWDIVHSDHNLHIVGNVTLIVDGNVTETVKGDVKTTCASATVNASGDATLKAGGTARVEGGNTTVKGGTVKIEGQTTVQGQTTINGGGNITLNAGTIALNGNVDVG